MKDDTSVSYDMDNRRRFVFRGNAAAFGGHLARPENIVLEAPGSALPVTGGRSVSIVRDVRRGELFSVKWAKTFAEGLFDNFEQYREYTYHRVEQDTLSATTRVYADIRGLSIGRKPRMTIGRMRAEFTARSPLGSGQPTITVANIIPDDPRSVASTDAIRDDDKETGVAIHDIDVYDLDMRRHTLIVELNVEPFQRFNTHAKLVAAADDDDFVKTCGDALLMRTARSGETAPPPAGRLIQSSPGTLYTTIVKSIRWAKPEDPYPRSEIRGNKVILPEFGRVFFGELLITEESRRLTMVRWALGSDGGGDASGADVQDNGGWGWSP